MQAGRRALLGALAAAPGLAVPLARPALAQPAFPGRPVTLTVTFAPGGTTDVIARLISVPMGRLLGVPVVVENVAGASGNLGAARVARGPADGHSVLVAHMGMLAVNPHLYRNIGYDPLRDIAPVGLIATNPMVLLVRPGIPDIAALRARAAAGELRLGTAGSGSTLHLAALQLLSALDGRGDMISYRGGAPAINDLIAGQIDVALDQALTALPHAEGGRVRALATTGATRLAKAPTIPTAAEAGLPGLDIRIWNALYVPAAAPAGAVQRLSEALSAALDDPSVRDRLIDFSADAPTPAERGPAPLAALLAADHARWGELVRRGGVRPED